MADWQDSLYELPPLPDTLAGDELPPQYSPPATPAAAAPPVPEYGPGFGVPLPFDEWGLEEQASPAEQPVVVPVDPATDPPSMGRTGALAPGYELADTELTKPELPGALVSEGVVEGMPFAYDLDQPVEAPTPDYELGVDTDAARMYQEDAARNAAEGDPIDPYAASPYEGLNPEEMTTTGLAMANQMAAAERERRQAEQLAELAVEQQREAERRIEEERIARAREDLAIEELNREAEELSEQGVDTGRWWNSRSTGQKVAGFASAFLAGFMQPLQGGPNQILDLMDREIDRDIAAQKADMHNSLAAFDRKRGLVREYYDRLKSSQVAEYQAKQVYWQGVVNRINQEAAQFDANGFARRNAELLKRGAEAKAAESRAQAEAALREEGRKERELRMKEAKTQADIAKIMGKIGGGRRKTPSYNTAAERWGLSKDEFSRAVWPNGPDKQPFVVGSSADKKALDETLAGGQTLTDLIDKMIARRKKYGSNSEWVNSKEFQQQRATWNAALIEMNKVAGLGALAGEDLAMLRGMIDDPNKYRDPIGTLEDTRDNIRNKTRTYLKTKGYSQWSGFDYTHTRYKGGTEYEDPNELAKRVAGEDPPGIEKSQAGMLADARKVYEMHEKEEPGKGSAYLEKMAKGLEANIATREKAIKKAKSQKEIERLKRLNRRDKAVLVGTKQEPGILSFAERNVRRANKLADRAEKNARDIGDWGQAGAREFKKKIDRAK